MIKKIRLPLFDLKFDKIEQAIKHEIELHETHLLWSIICYLEMHPRDTDELPVIKSNQYINQVDFIVKAQIAGVQSYFDNNNEVWVLTLINNGEDVNCKFETEQQMRYVEDVLHKWLSNQL